MDLAAERDNELRREALTQTFGCVTAEGNKELRSRGVTQTLVA